MEDGLGVPAFDKNFDDHFELNSELIKAALEGTFHECCASFPQKKMQPEAPIELMRGPFKWRSS